MKTIFFSIFDSSLLIEKNDINDDESSFAKFFKIEEKLRDTTNSETNSKKRIKIESQNSQSK